MAITRKNQKFIDEYMVDLNATQAAIRAGYSVASARSQSSRMLTNDDIRAEITKRMRDSRMTADEVIARLEAMALGEIPTKTVETPGVVWGQPVVKSEYDVISALMSSFASILEDVVRAEATLYPALIAACVAFRSTMYSSMNFWFLRVIAIFLFLYGIAV